VWSEGPSGSPKKQSVRWSDIPNNQIMQFHPGSNIAGTYRTHVGHTNGRTIDAHVW
jgi:sugar lactone lactonase YvrE